MCHMKIVIFSIKVLLIYLVFIAIAPLGLKKASQFLSVSAPLYKADIIVVLSGGHGDRVDKAVQLYKKGVSQTLLMTGDTILGASIPHYMKLRAIKQGVPSKNIFVEENSTSTYDHPRLCLPILNTLKVKSLLVVSSKFHTRRSFSVFKKAYAPYDLNIGISGAEDGIDHTNWWRNSSDAERVLLEYSKHLWYWTHY